MKISLKPAVLVALLAFSMLGVVSCSNQIDARRRGEVTITKGGPVGSADVGGAHGPKALVLHGLGYSLSDDVGALTGPFEDDRFIGSYRALNFTKNLSWEIERNKLKLESKILENYSITNDPYYQKLTNYYTKLGAVSNQLSLMPGYTDGSSEKRDDFLTSLAAHRVYLVQLQSDLQYIQNQFTSGRSTAEVFQQDKLIPRDLLVQILGSPISYGEFTGSSISAYSNNVSSFTSKLLSEGSTESLWVNLDKTCECELEGYPFLKKIKERRDPDFLNKINPNLKGEAFDHAEDDFLENVMKGDLERRIYFVNPDAIMQKIGQALKSSGFLTNSNWFSTNDVLQFAVSNAQPKEAAFAARAADFQMASFMVADQVQNLVESLKKKSTAGFIAWDYHARQPKAYPWDAGLERMIKHTQLAIQFTDQLIEAAGKIMKSELDEVKPSVIKTETYARGYADLTGRAYNRQLRKGTDENPLKLTILLKTLFVKNLGDPIYYANTNREPKSGDLLVIMKMSKQSGGDNAYPLIYQQNFLPDSFVNVNDRIVYGPAAYDGTFMDLQFQLLRASPPSTNTDMIRSGFSSLMSKVALANPEFATISPVVSALFNGIVDSATREQRELEVQWTIPAEESSKSANTDSLLAETGIYIVIKTESRFRSSVDMKAAKALYMSQLVYDPETAKLYWRRSFTDSKRNFSPDNEFRDKTYAVFALVDDYEVSDTLGDTLRKNLATVVGTKNANQIVPQASDLGATMSRLLESSSGLVGSKLGTDDAAKTKLSKWVAAMQKQLYSSETPGYQEGVMKALRSYASPAAQATLGNDIEKWRTAILVPNVDATANKLVLDIKDDAKPADKAADKPVEKAADGAAPKTGN